MPPSNRLRGDRASPARTRLFTGTALRFADPPFHKGRDYIIITAHGLEQAHITDEVQHMTGFNAPLRRPRSNRMIAGVVAGLAEYLGMDVALARVLFVLISIFSAAFPGVLVYVIFWVLVPEEQPGEQRYIPAQ